MSKQGNINKMFPEVGKQGNIDKMFPEVNKQGNIEKKLKVFVTIFQR